jgi:hypothetical protein
MKRLISLAALFVPTVASAHDGLDLHLHLGHAVISLSVLGVLIVGAGIMAALTWKRTRAVSTKR